MGLQCGCGAQGVCSWNAMDLAEAAFELAGVLGWPPDARPAPWSAMQATAAQLGFEARFVEPVPYGEAGPPEGAPRWGHSPSCIWLKRPGR